MTGDSIERINPRVLEADGATGQSTLALHLERYRWGAARLRGGRILDLACGVGYGSALLAELLPGAQLVAADISRTAVMEARRYYAHHRVRHVIGSGGGWARPATFDAIVSLETIEHVEHPARFIEELVRLLVPGGTLVASVPVTPSVDVNPHHKSDFTERSFADLVERFGLAREDAMLQVQPFNPFRVLARREARTRDLRSNLWHYYLGHPRAAGRRLAATLRYGFANRYLTVAWRKPA